MRSSAMRLMGSLVGLCLAGSLGLVAWPAGSGAIALPAVPVRGLPLTSLVVPASEALTGDGQVAAQEASRHADPEAFAARRRSRTAYANLSAAAARQVALHAFPGIVNHPDGGPPSLPSGERIVHYAAANVAQIELPGGRRAVAESTQPMAIETSPGHWGPLNLGLVSARGGYQPALPAAAVQIPRQVGSGVRLRDSGVSLTPTDARGRPLAGAEGVVQGASVLYANTQVNTDTLAKPITDGFEIDSLLRSANSPGALFFKVGIPAGARLLGDARTGGARVVFAGQTIVAIPMPTAKDAAGTAVPVKTSVKGDALVLSVDHSAREYEYPIAVDPTTWDTTLEPPSGGRTNWQFEAKEKAKFKETIGGGEISMRSEGSYAAPEKEELFYPAYGEASVTNIEEESAGTSAETGAITKLEFAHGAEHEGELTLNNNSNEGRNKNSLFGGGKNTNEVRFNQTATLSGGEPHYFGEQVFSTTVTATQTKGPEAGFNTTEANLASDAGRQNGLYGSGSWIGEHSGAFEIRAHDPGLGVSYASLVAKPKGATGGHNSGWSYQFPIYTKNECAGMWCNENYDVPVVPGKKETVDGEFTLELKAEDKAELTGTSSPVTLKVDNTPPTGFKISGMPSEGAEISLSPHKIRVEATDGTSPVPSSGIKSVEVKVDGQPVGVPQGYCTPGPCTSGGEWTLYPENLGSGTHSLEVVATDNANNKSGEVFTFGVRAAKQVSMGPGSIEPLTGEFVLTASDVDIPGVGGISRTFTSRGSTQLTSPFGPQWSATADTAQSLTRLEDGSVMVTDAKGSMTIFAYNKGSFESPEGDGNVKITSGEVEGRPVYYMADAAKATKTEFAQPPVVGVGSEASHTSNFGSSGSGAGQLKNPWGLAVDPSGNIWVADSANNRVDEFNEKNEFMMAFGFGVRDGAEALEVCTSGCQAGRIGAGQGQLKAPDGLATDGEGNVWVSDTGNGRVEEFSPSGAYMTTVGSAGSGAGQFNVPEGLTIDSSGNLWVADNGNHRIQEFDSKGKFIKTFGFGVSDGLEKFEICTSSCQAGRAGSGNGQFQPGDVAVDRYGDIWVADVVGNRVQEFNSNAEFMKTFGFGVSDGLEKFEVCGSRSSCRAGIAGSGNGQFNAEGGITVGPEGDLWVADSSNNRVQVFAPGGEYITKFGSKGTGEGQFERTSGVAVSGSAAYVLDSGNARVQKWTVPAAPPQTAWLPTVTEGPLATPSTTYMFQTTYGEGKWVVEPTEELAPKPSGVSCPAEAAKMEKGCRALFFKYASETNAGEGQSEWNEYKGRLVQVSLEAYNPSSKKMEETHVAQYAYDKKGLLRAEWDPRISPALKTVYGYDSEGHVTSLTPPGEESWAFTYGTIAGDTNAGRLLRVTRAPASAELWNGKALENTGWPKLLAGAAKVGVNISATKGTWNNGPIAYSYQWEDCNSVGSECVPILGATNPDYTVAPSDVGHKLVAQVTATNGGGSVRLATSATESTVSASGFSYDAYFGSVGAENGQFKEPKELALDSSGDIWVADYGNNRLEEFSSSASFIRAIGTAGTEAGQFKNPAGVAVSPTTGEVYVTDVNNNRVEVFSSTGSFVRTFGFGVSDGKEEFEVCTASCRAGISGSGSGQFTTPNGVTVDPYGHVWVTDYSNRVQEFSSTGAFILAFGSSGTGNGQFNVPNGLVVCGGNLYVTDLNNNRVEEFTLFGGYESQFGSAGTGNGQFTYVSRIACDQGNGLLYVSDKSGNRVEQFNLSGTFTQTFGSAGTGLKQLKEPIGLAVGPSGSIYVSDSGNNRVEIWSWGPPVGAAPSTEFASKGTGEGQLGSASGLTTDPAGNVWVADTGNNRVEEFNENGGFLRTSGVSGTGEGQFKSPEAIATDSHGNVWVTDTGNNRVEELNSEGKYVKTVGSSGSGNGQFTKPEGLTVDANGNLWVADSGDNRVEELNEAGTYVKSVGSVGAGNGQLKTPSDVVVDAWGDIWVDDYGNHRLEEFNSAGSYITSFGSEGTGNSQFKSAARMSRGPEGNIWVSDSGNNDVKIFSPSGEYLEQFGTSGTGIGQMKGPSGVGIHGSNIYVLDKGNFRIEKWVVPPRNEGEYVAPGPGTTIEYRVPVSGTSTGAPNLSEGEVAKWGQTDVPYEATAIFPPTKPMGWPASEYAPASIYYFDERGRTVNIASPGGGISTSEYNATNDVVRTLTADNRATALKEAKPAEASKLLDTENTYNSEGTELLEVLGPQHTVKLEHGKTKEDEEVLARSHVINSYDEGAPEGETLGLLTKTVTAAETASKEEFDKHETITAYSGQSGLGWMLREPTSVTVEPSGLKLTTTTVFDPVTGLAVETKSPVGSAGTSATYVSSFGSAGSGNGQFNAPRDIATDPSGNMWVVDSKNNRIEEFNSSGAFVRAVGSEGTGNGQFKTPAGVALDGAGNVWVADDANSRVEEFNPEGGFIRSIGSFGSGRGQLNLASGVTVDSGGNVWVTDRENNRVEEFNHEGVYLSTVGTAGAGNGQLTHPDDLAFNSENDLYALDEGNFRVEEFGKLSATPTYAATFGSEGTGNGQMKGPGDMTTDSSGNVWVADSENNRVEEFSSSGTFIKTFGFGVRDGKEEFEICTSACRAGVRGAGEGQFSEVDAITVSKEGNVFVTDTKNNRIEEFTSEGAFVRKFGSFGYYYEEGKLDEPEGLAVDASGNVWVADTAYSRIEEFSATGVYTRTIGSVGSGEFSGPRDVGFDGAGNMYVLDTKHYCIQVFNSAGTYIRRFGSEGSGNGQMKFASRMSVDPEGDVWLADGENNRLERFSPAGNYMTQVGTAGNGNGQFKWAGAVSAYGTEIYALDDGNNRIERFTTVTGEYIRQFGSKGTGNGQWSQALKLTVDPKGNVLVGTGTSIAGGGVEEFSGTGTYLTKFGSEGSGPGQFKEAAGIAAYGSSLYVVDRGNNRVERWNDNPDAHNSKTIYYSSAANSEYMTCGEHPEWVNLPCESRPSAQPEGSLPELTIKTFTYNMFNEAAVTTETFGEKVGATTRTKTETYDAAGRPVASEVTSTSTEDKALPKVTDEYGETTGALVKQSTEVEGKTKTVTSAFNKLGGIETYTDADGNVAKYTYDEYGRLKEASEGKSGEAESTRTYTYDATTGAVRELGDSQGVNLLKFTASYDVEGRMTSVTYPNAMTANYTYNPVGEATGIEYVKTAHCKTSCNETWFKDTIVPSIYGAAISQASTLSSENYAYDAIGRLTETQETPAGKGCEVRLYAYDEESNRLSLTTRAPGGEGKCATSGGTLQSHTYDAANRLIDSGVTYDKLDNITKLPAADAGKEEGELASAYYVDNQVEKQTQNGETIKYFYDPTGRARETVSEGKTASTVISHYGGSGEMPSWTSEGSGKWSRNIVGVDGSLTAIQKSGEAPVLQLHDLEGNIVATAAASESNTELVSKYNSTEFGVPTSSKPPVYSWLGAGGVGSELPSGVSTQGGRSYVPQVALALQVENPVPPGAFANGHGEGQPFIPYATALDISSGQEASEKLYAEVLAEREAAAQEACVKQEQSCVPEDPIDHYTAWEAKEKAAKIWEILKEVHTADLVSELASTALDVVFGAVYSIVTENLAIKWFESLARKFEFCANYLHEHKDSHGGCRLSYSAVPLTKIPYFWDSPVVSVCEYMQSNRREVKYCQLETEYTTVPGTEA